MMRRGISVVGLALVVSLTGCNRAAEQAPSVTMNQAAEALATVTGYHVHLETPPTRGTPAGTTIDLDVHPPASGSGTYTSGGVSGRMIFDNHVIYAQGADFAQLALPPGLSQMVGSQWFAVTPLPRGAGLTIFDVMGYLTTPEAFSSCFATRHGTLSVTKGVPIGGTPVTVIIDKGEIAGTAPMRFAVASSGAPYPVRIDQTGSVSDGTGDVCRLQKDISLTYSQFGQLVAIDPPKSYVTIPA